MWGASPDCVPDIYTFPIHMDMKSLWHLSELAEPVCAQKEHVMIGLAIQAVQQQKWPGDTDNNSELTQLWPTYIRLWCLYTLLKSLDIQLFAVIL